MNVGHPIICKLSPDYSEMRSFGLDNVPGCYGVFDGDVCLYVGRSRRLLTRVMAHWIDQRDGNGKRWRVAGAVEWYFKKEFAPESATLKVWKSADFMNLEVHLIEAMKPTFNGRRYPNVNQFGYQRVEVSLLNGKTRTGIIRGESRDKSCWRINLDGDSRSTVERYAKSRCKLIT